MTLITYVFPKLQTAKNMVSKMSKKTSFRSFENHHGNWSKILFKYEGQHLYNLYWSLWRQLTNKKFLVLFINTLTADDNYSLLNKDNLTQPIKMQFSKKPLTFSELFCAFFKSRLNFEHFRKRDDPHSLFISEITDCEWRN